MEKPQSDPARIKALEEGTPIGSATETSSSCPVSEGQASGSAPPLPSSSAIDRLTAELAEAVNDVDGWIEACRAAEDRAESAESQLAALREVLTSVQAMFEHGDKFPQDREPLEPWASNQAALRDTAKAAVAAALASSRLPSRQEEGRKDNDVTRIGQPDVPPAPQHASTDGGKS